jgi:type II secretory pathway pseudopilin PulG
MKRAFSLLEVVIAVGVFAGAIVVILALLPSLTTQASRSADALAAQRLPDALRVELQRLATVGGFDALATNVPVMSAPLDDGLALVASRDAARLHALSYRAPAAGDMLLASEQFFLIEIWRFPSAPLAYDASGAALPVHVRVSWPYRVPSAGSPTALSDRASLTFNSAIVR